MEISTRMLFLFLIQIYTYEDDIILSEHEKILIPMNDLFLNVVKYNFAFRVKPSAAINRISHSVKFDYNKMKGGHRIKIDGCSLCNDNGPTECINTIDYWKVKQDDNGYKLYLLAKSHDLDYSVKTVCLGVDANTDEIADNSKLVVTDCIRHDSTQVFRILDKNTPMNRDFTLNRPEMFPGYY